jgi:hypothetical protein
MSTSNYNITSGSPVYVSVDGQPSQSQSWPTYVTTSATLPLSQTNLTLNVGQSAVITASVSATLTMTNNSNPQAAGVSINGNQVTVNAFAYGNTNITICGGNIGCGVITLTVLSSTASQSSVTFNPTSATIGVGQSQTIQILGNGPFYVSSNSNTSVVTALTNGSNLILGGVQTGSATISVCSSASATVTCNTIPVSVSVQGTNSNSSTATTTLTFGKTEADLTVGQTQILPISGGTSNSYILSDNTNPSNVTASISNGNGLSLTAVAFGSSNVTVCQADNLGSCGTLYVYVTPNVGATATTATNTSTLALSSFTISSGNNTGKLLTAGNRITFTVTANQSISSPVITVAGNATTVTGTGSGPYIATYTVTGNESQPVPVAVTFTNPAGVGSQAYFWFSNLSSITPSQIGSQTSTSNTSGLTFGRQLSVGSSGDDVTALQIILKKNGYYSGPVTGTFGTLTKAAVKKYQSAHSLNQVGVVGPATLKLLNQGI